MRRLILVALCTILPVAAAAQAFRSESKLMVVPTGTSDFEVIEARSRGPRGIWCAAADYAKSRLGANDRSELYLKTPRGPSVTTRGRTGIGFTIDPGHLSAKPNTGYSLSVSKVGYQLRVGHAYSGCSSSKYRNTIR